MKTAIVTGASGGIGGAVAKKLCEQGFSTAIHYNTAEEKAQALSSSLVCAGYDAFPVQANLTDSRETQDLFDAVVRRNGRLDVLVNNAGLAEHTLFDTLSDAQWETLCGVNLTAALYCCRAAAKQMLRQKSGRIVNISSMWGQTGAAMEVAYSAAKAGVIGLTKALAKELAPSGILVNCVAPGAVDTAMLRQFSAEEIANLCEEIPLGRLASPGEIAAAVAFFTSADASFITGQVLGVNGGMVI
ncbi:MAG: 3-oxoacyl-ACP reductase FabG [Clostridia bacterium]|nr:3-oxoacyl-ACP reductase FabG [Clostridia bacterium]